MTGEVNITGWDFSPLTKSGRMKESPLPWDYYKIVKEHLIRANTLLDMGTGGGEFLKTLAPLPRNTYATEGYEPNVKIAEENLKPLGVKVIIGYKDSALPFENNFFELVINRHEYYDPKEVSRILKPGGYFITQQVKGNCDDTIIELFSPGCETEFKDWCMDKALSELGANGFEILLKQDANGFTEFRDPEALISYIRVINWLVPDFSIEKYHAAIDKASSIMKENGGFKSTFNRFLIVSRKLT